MNTPEAIAIKQRLNAGQVRVLGGTDPSGYGRQVNVDSYGNLMVAHQGKSSVQTHTAGLAATLSASVVPTSLFHLWGYNSGPDQFIQVWDRNNAPAAGDSNSLITVAKISAASNFYLELPVWGLDLTIGCFITNSTTAATYTAGAADCWINAVTKA